VTAPGSLDDWDARHARGECSLADALLLAAHAGVPLSPYLVAQLELAFRRYAEGQTDDLAEAFGVAARKLERNAQAREALRSHVRFHVDHFHAQGAALQDPGYFEGTAFERAAELLGKKPAWVFDLYYGKR